MFVESKVSIIIPIYNLEKTIEKCIKSIILQSIKNIEIILVNDGSTDCSLQICELFKMKDPRIIIINQDNKGVELARQAGRSIAKGEYIIYVDGDDWIPQNAVELLLKNIKKYNADIVVGNIKRVIDDKGLICKKYCQESKIIEHKDFMNKYFISFFGVNIIPVNMWAKMYRKSFLDSIDIESTGLNHGEDLCFNMQIFPYANRIVTIPDVVYYYRFGGMTNKMNIKLMDDACKAYNMKKDMIDKFSYEKARVYIAYELKNFLITYVESYILYTNIGKNELISIIEKEMRREEIRKAIFLPKPENYNNDAIVKSIQQIDAERFYTLIYKNATIKKIKRKILNNISKILNYI